MVMSIAMFVEWLRSRGKLHDAGVSSFCWDVNGHRLEIAIDDANWNNEGTPDYAGRQPAVIVLNGVTSMEMSVNTCDELNIYLFEVHGSEQPELRIAFWPDGIIACRFVSVDIIDAKLKA